MARLTPDAPEADNTQTTGNGETGNGLIAPLVDEMTPEGEESIKDVIALAGDNDVNAFEQALNDEAAYYAKLDQQIEAFIAAVVDTGIPKEQVWGYVVTAYSLGELGELVAKLDIDIDLAALERFFGATLSILGKIKDAIAQSNWTLIATILVTALFNIKWFGNLIFGGPSDSFEAFRSETGRKGEYEAWREDAKKRKFGDRLEKWVKKYFGASAGRLSRALGPLGLAWSVYVWQDSIRGSATYFEDKLFSYLGKDRGSVSEAKLDIGTPMWDMFGNEFEVIEGDKVKLVSDSALFDDEGDTYDLFVDVRSDIYFIEGKFSKSFWDTVESMTAGLLPSSSMTNKYELFLENPRAQNRNRGGYINRIRNYNCGGYVK